ncbi:pyridoxamine 5'-phosphate oxidase family protein [Micromonospora sp. NPDC049060]|uniref:pyridoxamine 5'-phosphate oxidase family protein n=1 Tax=Micromonospora sp. NPDC049060 TaxID=3154828 RepID=UPI0033DB64A3
MAAQPRTLEQRKHDTLVRLGKDLDAWVTTASDTGVPHLVPLSFLWDGGTLTFATGPTSVTGRNLRARPTVRMAIGPTRDVVLVNGTVEAFSANTVPAELADAFAAKLWEARNGGTRWSYYQVTPQRILAWREENELPGRELMRDGRWLV